MQPQLFRFDLGYDGTEFAGSQRQPGRRTVQGVLEAALQQLTGRSVVLVLAGRTDRGVHAVGQVASGDILWRHPTADLARALNAVLPSDLVVYQVRRAPPGFHARRSARYREYRYRLWVGSEPPLLLRRYVWHVRGTLDLGAMSRAAGVLLGTHDFRSFAGKGVGVPGADRRTVRKVSLADWVELECTFDRAAAEARLLEFRIGADAFLPRMVRNIVGAMVVIGGALRPPDWIAELLKAGDRRAAPAPAPPQGLVLWRVEYPGDGLANHTW